MTKRVFKRLIVMTVAILLSGACGEASFAAPLKVVEKPSGSVDLGSAIMKVARQTIPSVVYIEVTESRVVQNPFGQFENDPFFKRFFGLPNLPKRFKQEMKG